MAFDHAINAERVALYSAGGVPLRFNDNGELVAQPKELIPQTNTAAAGSPVTLTIAAPPAGKFIYLAWLQIVQYAAAALTGGATPQLITTTNLPNNPVFTFPSALAIGAVNVQQMEGNGAIKATTAATAVTVVTPTLANCIYRINALYYVA